MTLAEVLVPFVVVLFALVAWLVRRVWSLSERVSTLEGRDAPWR